MGRDRRNTAFIDEGQQRCIIGAAEHAEEGEDILVEQLLRILGSAIDHIAVIERQQLHLATVHAALAVDPPEIGLRTIAIFGAQFGQRAESGSVWPRRIVLPCCAGTAAAASSTSKASTRARTRCKAA